MTDIVQKATGEPRQLQVKKTISLCAEAKLCPQNDLPRAGLSAEVVGQGAP